MIVEDGKQNAELKPEIRDELKYLRIGFTPKM